MNRVMLVFALLLNLTSCATVGEEERVASYLSLYYAAMNENEQLVDALLSQGAPVDLPKPDGPVWKGLGAQAENFDSPLQAAVRRGNTNIVRLILKRDPWVDHRCCDSPTALCIAKEAGHTEIEQLLLEAGADPKLCARSTSLSPNKVFQRTVLASLRSARPAAERRRCAS